MANTTTPKNATNKAPVGGSKAAVSADLPDFDKWDDRQIGFAPYWAPEVGDWCYARVIARDDRNPNFVRYLLKAYKDTECRTGPKLSGEPRIIRKGETFSMSVFTSLVDEFDFHVWLNKKAADKEIPIRIDAVRKTETATIDEETGEKRKVWNWRVRVAPEHRLFLDKMMTEWKRLLEGGEERPALEG